MSQLKKIYNLLDKKEKRIFFGILFLTLINTFVEILGITAVIPLISLTLNQDLSLFENFFFYPWLNNFSNNENFIFFTFLIILIIFCIKNFFIIFYNWISIKFYVFVGNRMSDDICQIYTNIKYSEYLKLKSSKVIYQTVEAIEHFKQSLFNLIIFILEILVLISIVIFLVFLTPVVSLSILFTLGFCSSIIFILFVKKNKIYGLFGKKYFENKISNMLEVLNTFKIIKIFNAETFFIKKFQFSNFNHNLNQFKSMFLISIPRPFLELLIISLLIISLYLFLEIFEISTDQIILTLGIYGVSFFRVYPSMTRILQSIQKFNFGAAALNELKEVLKLKSEVNINKEEETDSKFKKIDQIKLQNINFSYEDNKAIVLKNINYIFKKNIFYGIQGPTGSGKSTLIDIICGLLSPTKGSFTINSLNFEKLDHTWFKNISYVTQNINLINDTLEKNIALGINENLIDQKKIDKILKQTELEELKAKFLGRKNQFVGEKGIQISGGEKQRIGIARAIYFDRGVFIFDEATNALDKPTEIKIIKSLREILKNKIVIFISHDESTLEQLDVVLEIKNKELIDKKILK